MADNLFYVRAMTAALVALSLHPAAHAQELPAADHQHWVVVELFQSQGCSSCPPAEANLNALADKPHVLALSFGVTYWDQLGWKDTFATEAYTQRQWDYAHHRGRDTVWTPQVYVNGREDLVGTNRTALEDAIGRADSDGPAIDWSGNSVTIRAASHTDKATDVWLVRYDPRTLQVPIGGGENGGRTLAQRDVVRQFVHLGTWDGNGVTFALPPSSSKWLKTAALVQGREGGAIIGASIQNAPD